MQENATLGLFDNPDVIDAAESPKPVAAITPPPDQPPISNGSGDDGDGHDRHVVDAYMHSLMMRYGLSVVKDRAIPSVSDGQKPVQRRILFAMHRLNLVPNAKPIKSARVVGDVIGKYHPHGDSASYEAMVRMAQDFSLRYPLVDGQGNFGSRDGDSPAAMRYTEARLTMFAELLLSEVDAGTVDFGPNYDGSEEEPLDLPARLPMMLLNGASGIAVGMATALLSHNMREVAAAAVALMKSETDGSAVDVMNYIPGPDFPGGAQVTSSPKEIQEAYQSGRGSLRVRARWEIEKQTHGMWRLVITELPPGVSTKDILEGIGELTDPPLKAGKKDLTPEQKALKAVFLDAIDENGLRDESGKDAKVRIIIEPRSSRMDPDKFISLLLKHTRLETTVPVNMVTIGLNGKPRQMNLREILEEWIRFRFTTVTRRSETRLDKILKRIHILEGRMAVLLNIDEVIRIIRESDEPKPALMATFKLSEIQAEDILEIRLRQLAKLEAIKVENELNSLRTEEGELRRILSSRDAMRDLIVSEVEADSKKFGDDRRTVIEEAGKVALDRAASIPNEPCTVILSKNGWIRQRQGHGIDLATINFKDGDSLLAALETRTIHPVVLLDSGGRTYTLSSQDIPGGRSDGVPVASLADIQAKEKVVAMLSSTVTEKYLFTSTAGYGFICELGATVSRQKAGKAFMTVGDGSVPLTPHSLTGTHLCALSSAGKLLIFPVNEMKELTGGKGVQVMGLKDGESLLSVALVSENHKLILAGKGRGGKISESALSWVALHDFLSARARRGQNVPVKFEATTLTAE